MTRDRSEEQIIIIVVFLCMLSNHIGDYGYNHYRLNNHHHQTQVLKIVNFAGQPSDGSDIPAPVLVEELQVLWLQLMMIRMMVMVVMMLVIMFKSILLRF